jgi:hypothetical protein
VYSFILNMWIMRKVDAAWVQAQVPRWITKEQADTILATSQIPEGSAE